jgi:hypothetical protein
MGAPSAHGAPADGAPAAVITRSPRQAVPFAAVRLTDSFWAPKQRVYRERTIPHSWQYVQREIEDNEIAAGWRHETRGQDTPWNQANLHKVLETCAYALAQERDPALRAKVDGILKAIAGAQQPDGYVNALITVRNMAPWTNLDGQHEGYVAGHLIEAAVAHYQATGSLSFLNVARKLADHIYRVFITEKHEGVCGHAELELALIRLYRVTGERRYLELARNWIVRRGKPWHYTTDTPRSYFMDHLPLRQVKEVTGHAVRTMFYLTGAAEVATETGDESLKRAVRRLWRNTTQRKMYLTGSVGSQAKDEGFGPEFDLPNDGYCESCAACGLVYFSQALFLMDGESSSIDVLERGLYNAVLHGISLDGTSTYYRNPLSDANRPRDNVWVCCPPCLSRTLLRVQDYVYARTASDLTVNLYAAGQAELRLGGTSVAVTQETEYPWDGRVKLTLRPDRAARFGLRLRIPGWCEQWSLSLNGQRIAHPRREKGYALLERDWAPGDSVELTLSMPPTVVRPDPKVGANRGRIALRRGPLIYAFEGLDNDGQSDLTLPADPALKAERRPDLLNGVTVLTGLRADGRPFTAVPFYTLANRGNSTQTVWVRDGF